MSALEVYTDGSYRAFGPGFGSWSFVVVKDGKPTYDKVGTCLGTTINKMEFQAILEALKHFTKPKKFTIYSDSQYAVFSITKWSKMWAANNWMTKTGDPVKNKELLQEILQEAKRHKVSFQWIRGHAGHVFNERADLIAQTATRTLYQNWKENNTTIITL